MTRLAALLVALCLAACASTPPETDTTESAPTPAPAKPVNAAQAAASQSLADFLLKYQIQEQERREALVKKHTLGGVMPERNRVSGEINYKKAHELFLKGDYKNAIKFYEKAISANATLDHVYYEYAVSFYKVGAFKKSLVFLGTLEGTTVNQIELTYYQALNYMKLKENEAALAKFTEVRDENDPQLSPMAAMYAGLLSQSKENFEEAKQNFEFVLDFSKDPKLDSRAESAIEDILRIERFKTEAQKKFSFLLYSGVTYDENVLNIASNNLATDLAAYRALYGASFYYKAYYGEKSSLIPQLNFSDVYSVDKKFKSQATVQSADPMQVELVLPYRKNFKNSSLQIAPAYANLYMDLDETGRKLVYASTYVTTSLAAQHFKNWITEYKFEVSHDDFKPALANPALDDQTAMKYTAGLSQTRLFNSQGTATMNLDLLFTQNQAEGDNNIYQKLIGTLGASYPVSDTFLTYGKVDYLSMDFSKSVLGRKDSGYIVTAGTYHSLSERWSMNLSAQYYSNDSTVAFFDYDKFVVTTLFTFKSGFLNSFY